MSAQVIQLRPLDACGDSYTASRRLLRDLDAIAQDNRALRLVPPHDELAARRARRTPDLRPPTTGRPDAA